MRAFLEKIENDYLDDFVFTSKYQLQNLGVEIIDFDGTNLKSLDKYNFSLRTDIMIGSVEATTLFFKKCEIKAPAYLGYPESLQEYLGRKITSTIVGDLTNDFPYFIKPKNDVKLFTGTLCENENQLKLFKSQYPVTNETELLLSEPLDFLSEYRCFIHKGQLQGIHWYKGDFKIFPNINHVEKMIELYKDAPVSYTLDVGVIPFVDELGYAEHQGFIHDTVLVEVNDMWAIGSYGFDAQKYVRMTIDRFQEIYRNSLVNV